MKKLMMLSMTVMMLASTNALAQGRMPNESNGDPAMGANNPAKGSSCASMASAKMHSRSRTMEGPARESQSKDATGRTVTR